MKKTLSGSNANWLTAYDKLIASYAESEHELVKHARLCVTDELKFKKVANALGYEIHHVLPKCAGGQNEIANYVAISHVEHIRAHWYLALKDLAEHGKTTMDHTLKTVPNVYEDPLLSKLRFAIRFGTEVRSLTLLEIVKLMEYRMLEPLNKFETAARVMRAAISGKLVFGMTVRFDFGKSTQMTNGLGQPELTAEELQKRHEQSLRDKAKHALRQTITEQERAKRAAQSARDKARYAAMREALAKVA